MEGATAVEVMTTLTKIAADQESAKQLMETHQKVNERRITRLENTVGRQNFVSGAISAVTAGITMGIGWLLTTAKVRGGE